MASVSFKRNWCSLPPIVICVWRLFLAIWPSARWMSFCNGPKIAANQPESRFARRVDRITIGMDLHDAHWWCGASSSYYITYIIHKWLCKTGSADADTYAADTYTTWISEDWSRVHMRGCCGVSPGWCFNEAHLSLVSKHLICFFLLRIFILWLSELNYFGLLFKITRLRNLSWRVRNSFE